MPSSFPILYERTLLLLIFFRLLKPRDFLKSKIPYKIDNSSLKNTVETNELKTDIKHLNKLKERISILINLIFQTLNEDSVIPQILAVLSKRMVEDSVFRDNIPKYQKLLADLEKTHNEVANCKGKILNLNTRINELKNELLQPNEENDKVRD